MNELRPAIIRAHENGKGVREIARFLDIEPSTVSRTIKRFEETGSNENRKREKTARSRRNIQRTKEMIKRNPSTKVNSTRKLAKKLGISDFSARKILREDLGKKPFKFWKRQKLTSPQNWRGYSAPELCTSDFPAEASFEEGMERNHLGNFDQDRGQLSEATEGLHGCKRRTFWINLVVVIVICCILNKFVEKMLLKRKKIKCYSFISHPVHIKLWTWSARAPNISNVDESLIFGLIA